MRRAFPGFLAAGLLGGLACLLLTGCPGAKRGFGDDDYDGPVRKPGGKGGAAVVVRNPVKGDYSGVISGKVTFAGKDDFVAARNAAFDKAVQNQRDYCLTGKLNASDVSTIQPNEKEQTDYRVGKNGGLGNVYVWIEPMTDDDYFEVPKAMIDATPKERLISQPHCAFQPNATVAFPSYFKDGKQVPTGQKVVIENDARVSHNAAIEGTLNNKGGNQTLGERRGDQINRIDYVFKPDPREIKLGCSVHTWMKATIRVYEHPFATTTSVGADWAKKKFEDPASDTFGSYEIIGVPVGAKVRLKVWHAAAGYVTPANGVEVTLEKATKRDFSATPP